jgi:hypothetical protein
MATFRAESLVVNKRIGLAVFVRKVLRRMCKGIKEIKI